MLWLQASGGKEGFFFIFSQSSAGFARISTLALSQSGDIVYLLDEIDKNSHQPPD